MPSASVRRAALVDTPIADEDMSVRRSTARVAFRPSSNRPVSHMDRSSSPSWAGRPVKDNSGGLERRLERRLQPGAASWPLVLDEPTNGLGPTLASAERTRQRPSVSADGPPRHGAAPGQTAPMRAGRPS